jgi:hypothetical protein
VGVNVRDYAVTVTTQDACTPPMDATTTAVPGATAEIRPAGDTVATFGFREAHWTVVPGMIWLLVSRTVALFWKVCMG